MRNRLIELLEKADEATEILTGDFPTYEEELKAFYSGIADYLLDNGVIVLPCVVGDTVYRAILGEVYEYTVGSFLVDENGAWGMSLLFEQEEKKFAANMDCDNLGKTVFLTKEEAERKLAELEGDKE